jgi:hypothetical protein
VAQRTIWLFCKEVAGEFFLPGAKHQRIASLASNSIFSDSTKCLCKVNDIIAASALEVSR